jgi:type II secretory pathway pseudopilin PulG
MNISWRRRRTRRSGFTLVELVIVGALIALFSSLAVFGVQQQFRSNIKKATIGESRQIASALDFANLDTSIFPKLCFLTESKEGMEFIASQVGVNPQFLFAQSDIANRVGDVTFGQRVRTKWNGPYFAMAQSRAGVAQGRGGFVYMLLPTLPTNGPNNVNEPGGFRWPADPYNNPYVVYMLDVVPGQTRLQLVTQVDATGTTVEPTRKGNYANAVVSYGPNHFPGGEEFEIVDFGPVSDDALAAVTAPGDGIWGARLYGGRPSFKPSAKGLITHGYISYNNSSFNATRAANAWTRQFAIANGVPLPPSGFGIADPGSDDIVFEF